MKHRVVVFGSLGFVGSAIVKTLASQNIEVKGITRETADFAKASSKS